MEDTSKDELGSKCIAVNGIFLTWPLPPNILYKINSRLNFKGNLWCGVINRFHGMEIRSLYFIRQYYRSALRVILQCKVCGGSCLLLGLFAVFFAPPFFAMR